MSTSGLGRNRVPRAKDVRDQLSEVESMLGQAAKETGEKASSLFSQVEARLRSATDAVQSLQEDAIGRAGRREGGRRLCERQSLADGRHCRCDRFSGRRAAESPLIDVARR